VTLGTHPALSLAATRGKALEVKHAVAQGVDPATQKQLARHTPVFAEIAALYLDKHAQVHKKSWRDDARLLDKEVLPAWGRRHAVTVARRDVIALVDDIAARGAPIQANRVLALVRKVFNWAISRDLLAQNPCIQVQRPGKEHQRDRVLHEDEIRAVWEAFGRLDPVLEAYFKLCLLTAQRRGEVRTMQWEEVDLVTGWWTIPAASAKNGLAHRVPLSLPVQDILRTLQGAVGHGPWVFPSPRRRNQPITNIRKPAPARGHGLGGGLCPA
jgi:integrase